MAFSELHHVESWLSIKQVFVENLLQAAGRAVGAGGMGSRKFGEVGGPCPEAARLVVETNG